MSLKHHLIEKFNEHDLFLYTQSKIFRYRVTLCAGLLARTQLNQLITQHHTRLSRIHIPLMCLVIPQVNLNDCTFDVLRIFMNPFLSRRESLHRLSPIYSKTDTWLLLYHYYHCMRCFHRGGGGGNAAVSVSPPFSPVGLVTSHRLWPLRISWY